MLGGFWEENLTLEKQFASEISILKLTDSAGASSELSIDGFQIFFTFAMKIPSQKLNMGLRTSFSKFRVQWNSFVLNNPISKY